MRLSELRRRSNQFVKNLPTTIQQIVNGNDELEQLNRDQLWVSKLADGSAITRNYDSGYARYKAESYPESFTGKPNMKLTGDLYENLTIKTDGQNYSLYSNMSYTPKLIEKYGEIFGLSSESQKTAKAITTKALAEEYKKIYTS